MNTITSLPNLLTLMRIVLIPVLVVTFYLPFAWSPMVTAVIFALAGLTDLLDGYLARKLKQISPFGAFLDPVADKLLVTTSLLLLVGSHHFKYITLPAIIIVGREIVISALREWMAVIGSRASLAVQYIGKLKTWLQMSSLFLLFATHGLLSLSIWGILGFILLYLSAILTIWSMINYLIIAWPLLSNYHIKT